MIERCRQIDENATRQPPQKLSTVACILRQFSPEWYHEMGHYELSALSLRTRLVKGPGEVSASLGSVRFKLSKVIHIFCVTHPARVESQSP
jgi:hypothetical protein